MNILVLPTHAFVDKHTAIITNTTQLNHIHTVLKAQVGDELKIGQLYGKIGTGKIHHLDGTTCHLSDITLNQKPPAKLDVTVILALPRPKTLRRLMLDMTAFGVSHIIIINSARTDKSYWGSPLLNKVDEFILEGLQQGIDTVPPTIAFEKRFKPFVQDKLPNIIQHKPSLVLHPYTNMTLHNYIIKNNLPNVIIIGAEGGFVPYEIQLLQNIGIEAATLGGRILRTESAINAILGRYL
ncbi:16S rRNA (uracil(1498)-N(3))-methyltransferase [Moraxella oblonga]|uniref:16S rRNA (uracil(1498)-N(3))-methyltransferase n=1 Tax=Moraxella oblonga TaxID=200413 RepID=UPI000832F802|nr:16S rRNA (uracil(1498)-N(3))-methyltransferase [Moraxella oblonga]